MSPRFIGTYGGQRTPVEILFKNFLISFAPPMTKTSLFSSFGRGV